MNAMDIDWLERKAQESKGEEKISYLVQAVNRLSDQPGQRVAALLVDLGDTCQELLTGYRPNNLETAIQAYEQALLIYTQQATPYKWAMAQNNLGIAYQNRIRGERDQNLEVAIQAFEQTLLVYTQQATPYDWAMAQNNLGIVYQDRIQGERAQNIEAALQFYEKALLVYTQEDTPYDWAMVQNNLGIAYLNRIRGERAQNLEAALQAYEQALLVYTQQATPYEWSATQNNLASVYQDRIRGERADNLENAISACKQALLVYTQEDTPYDWAMAQNNLGIAYRNRIRGKQADNLEAALQAYKLALLVYTQQAAPHEWSAIQNNLASVYHNRIRGKRADNLEAAIKACSQALLVYTQQATPYEWAMTQNNLGNAYRERIQGKRAKNIEAAIQAYKQALLVRTQETVPVDCRYTALNLANLLYAEKRWGLACEAYQQAHEALELMRNETIKEESRRQLAKDNAALYAGLIHCCLVLDDTKAAANYALAGKSRTFTEQLAGEHTILNELLTQDLALAHEYRSIQQNRQELDRLTALSKLLPAQEDNHTDNQLTREKTDLHNKVAALRQAINLLTDNLVFKYPALSAIQPLPSLTYSNAQTLAAELGNISLVEYVRHGGGWGAFVITAQLVHYVHLPDDLMTQISQLLELFLEHNDDGRTMFWVLPNWREHLVHLYQVVFEPLLKHLPLSGQVVLAPTQALHLIPFQALLTENGVFISESYAFSFVPSLATLRILHEQSKHSNQSKPIPNRLLNVSHSGDQLNYLDNIRLEALEVGRQFEDPIYVAEKEATVERVIEEANKRSYQVVHFNCHGSFLSDNPVHSGLLLAQQRMLTVNDIRIHIRLKGRPLVTLSACQTGQTLPESGDETIGISWAFLAAGASSVLSSQWSVPDASTRELFGYFYQLRRQPSISAAEALQQAMLQLRKRRAYDRRPEYWAGFQVIGLPIHPAHLMDSSS